MSQKLTGRQFKALDALLAGSSVGEAATAAGVDRRTLTRWKEQPYFRTELTARETAALGDRTRQLGAAAGDAVTVMWSIVNDVDAPSMVKLRAADLILSHYNRQMELYDLAQRLTALETRS